MEKSEGLTLTSITYTFLYILFIVLLFLFSLISNLQFSNEKLIIYSIYIQFIPFNKYYSRNKYNTVTAITATAS